MAGGMGKRGSWGSLEGRLAAGRESDARATLHGAPFPGQRRPVGPDPTAPVRDAAALAPEPPPAFRHCWVNDSHGRLPGLLLEWRRIDQGMDWEGRVLHAVLVQDEDGEQAWELAEEWLPAGLLEQT